MWGERNTKMLRSVSTINHHAVVASDGRIGTVVDFLFDDVSWHVRWAVIKIGEWPITRKVLVPTSVLSSLDSRGDDLRVRLTMQQVRQSPGIDTERPVSRQMETRLFDHYGSSPYWVDGLYYGVYGFGGSTSASPFDAPSPEQQEIVEAQRSHDDPHLRSVEVVSGYHIHASDGEIGHVEDMIVDAADWTIPYLVVDTKNWWRGKTVLVSRRLVTGFDWHDRLVNIDADRHTVAASPLYDPYAQPSTESSGPLR
jgi:hypothetical protein